MNSRRGFFFNSGQAIIGESSVTYFYQNHPVIVQQFLVIMQQTIETRFLEENGFLSTNLFLNIYNTNSAGFWGL